MNETCDNITTDVIIQENGIIRLGTNGHIIGRLTEDGTYKAITDHFKALEEFDVNTIMIKQSMRDNYDGLFIKQDDDMNAEYRGYSIIISNRSEYGTHPYEWMIHKDGYTFASDPTSTTTAERCMETAKEYIDEFLPEKAEQYETLEEVFDLEGPDVPTPAGPLDSMDDVIGELTVLVKSPHVDYRIKKLINKIVNQYNEL